MTDEELGALIRAVRNSIGVTQRQLSDQISCWHWTTVAKIEKGIRSVKAVEIVPLARALGLNPGELLEPKTLEGVRRKALEAKIGKLKSEIELLEAL